MTMTPSLFNCAEYLEDRGYPIDWDIINNLI